MTGIMEWWSHGMMVDSPVFQYSISGILDALTLMVVDLP
jgi:hypothetical protein